MNELIQSVIDNRGEIIAILTSVVALASAVCALTPTPKDDGVVKVAYKVVEWLALNVGKAKQK